MTVYYAEFEVTHAHDAYSDQVVHVWAVDADEAMCGAQTVHVCPEAMGYAQLRPFQTRCFCNARVCAMCHKIWSGGS